MKDKYNYLLLLTLFVYIQKRIAKSGTFQLRVDVDGLRSVGTSSGARAYLYIGDTGVSILRAATCAPAALLPLQLGLDTQGLHLIHFADGLPEVFHEFTSVVLVSSVKCD